MLKAADVLHTHTQQMPTVMLCDSYEGCVVTEQWNLNNRRIAAQTPGPAELQPSGFWLRVHSVLVHEYKTQMKRGCQLCVSLCGELSLCTYKHQGWVQQQFWVHSVPCWCTIIYSVETFPAPAILKETYNAHVQINNYVSVATIIGLHALMPKTHQSSQTVSLF